MDLIMEQLIVYLFIIDAIIVMVDIHISLDGQISKSLVVVTDTVVVVIVWEVGLYSYTYAKHQINLSGMNFLLSILHGIHLIVMYILHQDLLNPMHVESSELMQIN